MKVAEINKELVGKKVSFSYNHTEATGKIIEVSSDNKYIVIAFDYFIRNNQQNQNAAIFKAGKLGLMDGNLRTVCLLPENLQPSKKEVEEIKKEVEEEAINDSIKEELIAILGGEDFLKSKNIKILGEADTTKLDYQNKETKLKGILLAVPTNSYKANRCYLFKDLSKSENKFCYDVIFRSEWMDKAKNELISNKKVAAYGQSAEGAAQYILENF